MELLSRFSLGDAAAFEIPAELVRLGFTQDVLVAFSDLIGNTQVVRDLLKTYDMKYRRKISQNFEPSPV